MKLKMIGAGILVATMAFVGAFANAAEPAAAADATAKAGEASRASARRAQLTPEQRAEMRAKREKFMAERRAAMEAKTLAIVKKYVPDEEKAKALVAELEASRMSARRAPVAKGKAKE